MGNREVCILTSAHPATDVRVFHKQARSLAKAGYSVVLIGQHEKDETIEGVRIIGFPRPRSRFRRFLNTLRILRSALRQQVDVYHFHDPDLIPAGLVLRLLGKKVIYDVHEDYYSKLLCSNWIPGPLRRPLALTADFWEKLLSRCFDAIVVVDVFLRRRFGGRAVKVSNFPSILSLRQIERQSKGVFTCAYAGGLSQDRGIIRTVEALEHVSTPVRLLLLGPFMDRQTRETVESVSNSGKVKYLGYVSPREVAGHIAAADVGMLVFQPVPAYKPAGEGCLKLFEYMLMGLPVIASDFPFLRQILERNQCGVLVDPANPKDIAAAIEYLSLNRDRARRMGENGRKAVLDKYNWESQQEKMLHLYEYLLGGRRRRRLS